jgi:hypothetical protein
MQLKRREALCPQEKRNDSDFHDIRKITSIDLAAVDKFVYLCLPTIATVDKLFCVYC